MKKSYIFLFLTLFTTQILRGQNTVAFTKVYSILQTKCVSCHSATQRQGNLDLEGTGTDKAGAVFTNLVGKVPANATAAAKGQQLVYPGRVDRSFIFHKVNNKFDTYYEGLTAAEGAIMPNANSELTKVEKEIIRQWILFGATKTATIPEDRIRAYYDTTGKALSAFETPPPAPAASEGFQIRVGPFFLAPNGKTGSEAEYFQKWEVNLANDMEVNRIDHIFSSYSHHFLIYNFTNTTTPASLAAGLRPNAYHNNINLISAVQEKTDLKLPTGAAFKWEKNRVLDLNTHYINYSANHVYKADAYLNFYTQPKGTAKQEMFAILVPNVNISIPNNNQTITSEANFLYVGKAYIWSLMGHTHKYGTGYKIFKRLPNGTKGEVMYDAGCPGGVPGCASPYYDYQHIPMRFYKPLTPVELNPGFVHQATWKNGGDKAVTFGATSDDEMMVMVAMYTLDTVGIVNPVKETKALDNVLVYPNPMREKLTIVLPPSVFDVSFTLYDMLGKVVMRKTEIIGSNTIDIPRGKLETGMYIYRVEDGQGRFKTGKVYLE
jgi:hypothetical protein